MQSSSELPTVYTVRLSTGFSRGSGLEEPSAGVQLCLIGESGEALLHYVPPIFDPQKLQSELEAINKVRIPLQSKALHLYLSAKN